MRLRRSHKNLSCHMPTLEADAFGVFRRCSKTLKVSRKHSQGIQGDSSKTLSTSKSRKARQATHKS
jgi:hypothetical protein